MNFEPAISCLVEAAAETGERLANLELLADTEFEKARVAKYRGEKEVAKKHLLTRRNYEAEASRFKKLLHETEELLGKFQIVTAKHKLLRAPVPIELELLRGLKVSQSNASNFAHTYDAETGLDAELAAMKSQLLGIGKEL